jgi:hypothetical protein
LFVISDEQVLSDQAREYIKLCWEDELLKLRQRFAEPEAATAKEAAAKAR